MPLTLIDTPEVLASYLAAGRLGEATPVCAIDTEADSLHRYRESLCLIQFAAGEDCLLMDPLAIQDLTALGEFLRRAVVWMHGADYDMTMLKRQFGDLPAKIYDTQIGARLLGLRRFGLADLVLHYFGLELSKTSQKADWGKRPLTPKMVEYALNDVRYLLPMADQIVAQLRAKGRYEWFEESCESALTKVLERDDSREDAWRIQGSGKFDPYCLACLRALWYWRDNEAALWDRPSFMVATNRQLIEWSAALAQRQTIALPRHFRPERLKRFNHLLQTLDALPESEWPARPKPQRRKRDREFERQVECLLEVRDQAAAALDIESSLIASRAALETLAADEDEPTAVLLSWQLDLLRLHP
jgi:ribonuclease D